MAPITSSHREALLDAAEVIIIELGVGRLTLERVAATAGVTKGGLIYHFKTREELLGAVIERMIGKIEARYTEGVARRGRTLKAYLRVVIEDCFSMDADEKALMASLLAAISACPDQLGPVQRMYQKQAADLALDPTQLGKGLFVSCALDGMILLELLNLRHLSDAERTQMQQELLAYVEGMPGEEGV